MWGQKRWIERFLTAINSISWLANKILDYRTFLLSEQKIKKHVRQECDLEYCLLRGDKLEKAVLEKLSVYDRRVTGKGDGFGRRNDGDKVMLWAWISRNNCMRILLSDGV